MTPEIILPWESVSEHDLSIFGGWGADSEASALLGVTQTRVFTDPNRSDFAVIVAEMNSPNVWNDKMFDEVCSLAAAAPSMLHALKTLHSDARPDNWADEDQLGEPGYEAAAAWRLLDVAIALAEGGGA
jgi:hypothetical protein